MISTEAIAGVPDVIFFNAALARLYVAIGDPGVIEVFDTEPLRRREAVNTDLTRPGVDAVDVVPGVSPIRVGDGKR